MRYNDSRIEKDNARQVKRSAVFQMIISSAVDIALEQGADALTMAAIAKHAGLSRTSLYEYFSSKEDLVADLLLDELKLWSKHLESFVDSQAAAQEKIDGWLMGTIAYMRSGHHNLMRQLSTIGAPKDRAQEIRLAHSYLISPLLTALSDLGVRETERHAAYLQGILDTAVRRIDAGNDADKETEYALTLARALLAL